MAIYDIKNTRKPKLTKKITFVGSRSPNAEEALAMLSEKYEAVGLEDAEIIVALGGD